MSFSPDGTLFATTGFNDRLVKIWFENKQCKFFICVMKIRYFNFINQLNNDSNTSLFKIIQYFLQEI